MQAHFLIPTENYDVIRGYRADDSYFTFAQDFVANSISLEQLSAAMRYGELGEQIVLMSQKAFSQIQFVEAIPADAETYFWQAQERDKAARKKYRKSKQESDYREGLYMINIMREGMEKDDPRLF